MRYDIRIIRSSEFVRLDAEGHFDMPATRTFFSDVIWACVRSRIGRVLVDVRDAQAELTVGQLCALANVCREVTPPADVHKIAILNRPPKAFDAASSLATMAQDLGWNIRSFQEFENAIEWLSE